MNCSNCGRHKQKQNLLDGICRTCRREGVSDFDARPPGPTQIYEHDPFKATAEEPAEHIEGYYPSQNAQPEGQEVSADLPLEAFSRLHHNQQTKYLKDRGVEWKPGEDRIELFKNVNS